MDLKQELINVIPTIPAKRILLFGLMLVPASLWILDEINPLWPMLGEKELVIAKVISILFLLFVLSFAANVFYIYKLKRLGRFIDGISKELTELKIANAISNKSKFNGFKPNS